MLKQIKSFFNSGFISLGEGFCQLSLNPSQEIKPLLKKSQLPKKNKHLTIKQAFALDAKKINCDFNKALNKTLKK